MHADEEQGELTATASSSVLLRSAGWVVAGDSGGIYTTRSRLHTMRGANRKVLKQQKKVKRALVVSQVDNSGLQLISHVTGSEGDAKTVSRQVEAALKTPPPHSETLV